MTLYRTSEREVGRELQSVSMKHSNAASHAQASAFSRLNSINVGVRRSSLSASTPLPSRTPTPSPYIPTLELPNQLSPEELAIQQQCLRDQDCRDAELELNRYEAESPTLHNGERVTDLVRYWEVSTIACISTTTLTQGIDLSAWRKFAPCSFELLWMSFLLRPLLYRANGYSLQARKLARFVKTGFLRHEKKTIVLKDL